MKKLLSILLASLLVFVLVGPPAAAQGGMTIIDLGTLGEGSIPESRFSIALAINDTGQVAGDTTVGTGGNSHAFLWTSAAGMQDLGTSRSDAYYSDTSNAADINNLGSVVGGSDTNIGEIHAFLWTATGGMQSLGTLGGAESRATSINDQGQVVGWSTIAPGSFTRHAFLWTETGGMQDLGTLLGGDYSEAVSINNLGQVVGTAGSFGGSGSQSFLWSEAAGMQVLDIPPGFSSCDPVDINDLGQVVGNCCSGEWCDTRHAFLWAEVTVMQDLGPLWANGINNLGQVVGRSDRIDPGSDNAYLWSPTTGMQNLGTLPGGSGSLAEAINNVGQVVGASGTSSGDGHAVLWQPASSQLDLSIDINPKSIKNIISFQYPKTVPIAILSSSNFNAVTQIARPSLTFGRTGAEASLFYTPRTGKLACAAYDANRDGYADLQCMFSIAATGFQCGDTQGILKGSLVDGAVFAGTDAVKIAPCP